MATAFSMAPPPDMALETPAGSLAEMSEAEVAAAVSRIKAGFLRFFVSMMVRYQELLIVPSSTIKQPAAVDFFDERRWIARFGSESREWLEMFCRSQTFTQWLEARLAPSAEPELEIVFFNEQIDAKIMRSTKGRLLAKHTTPLLSTGVMPSGGYGGSLVPPQVCALLTMLTAHTATAIAHIDAASCRRRCEPSTTPR
uniref:dDENN domain-containing protein n=1 Tax=Emiliania huxleyi TaxID=2903 RepID=A0A7S3WS00_EMIHU